MPMSSILCCPTQLRIPLASIAILFASSCAWADDGDWLIVPGERVGKITATSDAKYRSAGLTIISINLFEEGGGTADKGLRLDRFLDRHAPRFPIVRGGGETTRLFGGVAPHPDGDDLRAFGRADAALRPSERCGETHLAEAELEAAIRATLRLD